MTKTGIATFAVWQQDRKGGIMKRRKMKKHLLSKTIMFILTMNLIVLLSILNRTAILAADYKALSVEDMARFPGVSISSTGEAWTTDHGDTTNWRGEKGYTVSTGVEGTLRALKAGEHYYSSKAADAIPIGKWVVSWSDAQCIHDTKWGADTFKGFPCRDYDCMRGYNSGWFAYCADCNEPIRTNIYANPNTVKGITSIAANSWYVFTCPYCQGLEQTAGISHNCKKISNNFYTVTYNRNAPVGTEVTGYMAPTRHMYDNAEYYENQLAADIGYNNTQLRKNTYSAEGYVFKGWKTSKDSTSIKYTDEQEILNLTSEQKGTVMLYAHWERTESTLNIDANGGKYNGTSGVTSITKEYGESYELDTSKVTVPNGYTVRFDTNGGSSVNNITTTKSFFEWQKGNNFQGKLTENTYLFIAESAHIDTITIAYTDDAFPLPSTTKNGYYFAGWYTDEELTELAGISGNLFTTDEDTTLYAKWANLALTATNDYQSHNGTGAVDLSWTKLGSVAKYYKVYQSMNKNIWTLIHDANVVADEVSIQKDFNKNSTRTYTIEYTGYYELTASGAKGGNFGSNAGGNGGKTTATYWLKKGDIITFYSGTTSNGVNGGTNGSDAIGGSSTTSNGAGGGAATEVHITRSGKTEILMIAGGGGGASDRTTGGIGGGSLSTIGSVAGASNTQGGGGGGATGGIGGTYNVHNHTGDSVNGGGCYTKTTTTVVCGTASGGSGFWECGTCDDRWGDGSDSYYGPMHEGHNVYYCQDFSCSGCGKGMSEGDTHYKTSTVVKLTCTYYDKPNGYIISANASGGGTSYINTNYGCMNPSSAGGTNNGEGGGKLVSGLIGYHEDNYINDVKATDLAAPNEVKFDSTESIKMYGEDTVIINWETPSDNGTTYYHKVESYKD